LEGDLMSNSNPETILYGLANCDTCRKARKALESTGRAVVFRDVRGEPLTEEERARFLSAFGDRLINRASTTWRGLDEAERALASDRLLARHPALMKRPVTVRAGQMWLGWDAKVQAEALK
jgi:arsenate reductase-like glutaredoxin family protein